MLVLEKFDKVILSSCLLLFLISLLIKNEYTFHILIVIFHHVLLASSLNLIMSMGLLSFGQAAFMGIGAYTSALLMLQLKFSFWLALPIACFFAGIAGLIIGLITLNIRGIYFAITTLAFNAVFRYILINWKSLTNGLTGISSIPSPNPINFFNLFSIEFNAKIAHFYLMLLSMCLGLMVVARIKNSKVGRAFEAIRWSEPLTASIGIHIFRYKLLAFVIASIFAGFSGSLYAHYLRYISPESFTFWESFNYVVFVVVGGQGTFLGPIVGATLLTYIPEILRAARAYYMLAFGIVLILVILFAPDGILISGKQFLMKMGMRFFPERMKRYEIT